ncbi:hypothetical protein CARUB_v10023396mg [Capsella rubella]|uniref:Serpin domain-containing protein n=1 Tax=Capsella rubella TaxID=81985 RepID=R0FX46_9BRAS|nr:serpin-Z3 [Capsella rubella]EOA27276.1 hypothetical protein CARUB_v10023396mg [Capsella rubella]
MELAKSIEKQNDVVVKLAKQVIETVANGSNLVFSPTSINVLLSLIAAGSSSITREQILSFLMSPSTDHLNSVLAKITEEGTERSDLRLAAVNGVWIDKSVSLKASFKELLENSYKASCSQVDFATKPEEVIDEVNTWAEVHTNGLIKDILSRNSSEIIETIRESILVLANAVYFKAAWSIKFDANLTKDNDFYLLDGNTVKVPFMTNYEDQYLRGYDGFQVLRLPYVEDQRQFSMYIYLPNDKDGLAALLEKISSEPGFLDSHIPLHRVSVDAFRIPKFNFSFEFEASDVLKDMGLTLPFSSGGSLLEMIDLPSNGNNLLVSSILHKACIEVDEEGTEAAAVSVAIIVPQCLRRNPDFVADHPFLFTVREDKSGVVLFMGQVLDPSKH